MKPKATIPWWGSISLLWLMLTPIIVVAYTLLLPIAPNDFWYNARAGSYIVETGQIPRVALFTTSLPAGTPYYYQSWLAQVLFYKTLQINSLAGIVLLRTLVLTATFALLISTVWRRVQSMNAAAAQPLATTTLARVAALCTLLSFALSASNMDVRPQTFSVLFFAVWIFCIFEWPRASVATQRFIVVRFSILMVLWANTHGAFFVGLIMLAALFVGELLHFFLGQCRPQIHSFFGVGPRSSSLRALGFSLILCALAPLCNPRGFEIYIYVFKLAGDKASQKFIQEWRSPDFTEWYGALFFIALFITAAMLGVLLRQNKRVVQSPNNDVPRHLGVLGVRLGETIVLTVMSILALRDIRSIIWFAIFLAPFLAAMLARFSLSHAAGKLARAESAPPRSIQIANAIIALGLMLGCVPLLPQLKPRLGLPPEYSRHFAPNPAGAFPDGFSSQPPLLLDRDTPVEAVEYLKKNPPSGRLWNDMVFGSYLTWVGKPLEPFCDPRVEMYSLAFWEEYARLIEGPTDAPVTLRRQGFSHALLHRTDGKRLLNRLQQNGWRVVFQKGSAVLLRDSQK